MKKITLREIFIIAIPIIIEGIVLQIQSIVDKMFLGSLKFEYLSVIGNILMPLQITYSLIGAISTGLIIIVGQKYGAGDRESALKYTEAGLVYNSILSGILFLIWVTLSNPIFRMMKVDSNIIGYCETYMLIMSAYILIFGIDMTFQGVLLGIGKTMPIMYTALVKVVLNIVLDYIFIFGKFGMKEMGVSGAALGTALASFIGTALLLACVFLKEKWLYAIKIIGDFKAKTRRFKEIVEIGIPVSLETFIWYISSMVILRFLNELGYIEVGIYTLVFGIEAFIYPITDGIGRSNLSLTSQEVGKGGLNIRYITRACIKYGFILLGFIVISLLIFKDQVFRLFTTEVTLIEAASTYFYIVVINVFFKALNCIVGNGIRATGDTKWMLFTQCIGSVFVIMTAYILIFVCGLKGMGIYLAIALDEAMRSIINTIRFNSICTNKYVGKAI